MRGKYFLMNGDSMSTNIRWTPEQIESTTKKRQPAAQKRWFLKHFGIDVPCDLDGPIMTDETFEALVKKTCGIYAESTQQIRPSLRTGKAP